MRSFILLSFLVPVIASAQINRSARQLASEQIQDYVTHKLFSDRPYKPVSFGEIKKFQDRKEVEIYWTIEHKFIITEPRKNQETGAPQPKEYNFRFYLDDKMRVIKADSYFIY